MNLKSGSALLSSDKHKTNHAGDVSLWSGLAYDLEGLGALARQIEMLKRLGIFIGPKDVENFLRPFRITVLVIR